MACVVVVPNPKGSLSSGRVLCHPSRAGGWGRGVASPNVVKAFLGQNKNLVAQIDARMVPVTGNCHTHGISNWFLHTRLAFNRKLEIVVFSSFR